MLPVGCIHFFLQNPSAAREGFFSAKNNDLHTCIRLHAIVKKIFPFLLFSIFHFFLKKLLEGAVKGKLPGNNARQQYQKNKKMLQKTHISKEQIKGVFQSSPDFSVVLVSLYKLAIPEFSQVQAIRGYPAVSHATAKFILSLISKFYPSDEGAFLLWLNKGFSARFIPDFQIDNSDVTLIY